MLIVVHKGNKKWVLAEFWQRRKERRAIQPWQQASQWIYDALIWQYQTLLPAGVQWAQEMLSTSFQLENLR